MTDQPDLAALRALAEAATPGPWELRDGIGMRVVGPEKANGKHDILVMTHVAPPRERIADAAYIAACSPERILALIAEVESWQRQAVEASVRAERAEGNAARLADRLQRMDDEDDVLRHEADEVARHAR